jgi:ankyrin repeat protein
LRTVRTLLQCGADVNAIDTTGNTPLHVLASNSSICDETILQLLCNAGAHLDYTNALGETPIDTALNSNTNQLLKTKTELSLKCLCARLIQKNRIPFHETVPTLLIKFVERH